MHRMAATAPSLHETLASKLQIAATTGRLSTPPSPRFWRDGRVPETEGIVGLLGASMMSARGVLREVTRPDFAPRMHGSTRSPYFKHFGLARHSTVAALRGFRAHTHETPEVSPT